MKNDEFVLSDEVASLIDSVFPSSSEICRNDFNEIAYINKAFPNEQSLVNLDSFIATIESEIAQLDQEINFEISEDALLMRQGEESLKSAQESILKLSELVTTIKVKVETSEKMVDDITKDIKELDCAKKNITLAITTLNHLHLLLGGVDSLEKLMDTRKYAEIANLLNGILDVLSHFSKMENVVDKICEVKAKVEEIKSRLASQILSDFEAFFSSKDQDTAITITTLTQACLAVEVLPQSAKESLLAWYIGFTFTEYSLLFHEAEDIAWIDKIEKRFAWFKKCVMHHEQFYEKIFPPNWHVEECIALKFCCLSKSLLQRILAVRKNELNISLLLYAIPKLTNFELLLSRKFADIPILNAIIDSRPLFLKNHSEDISANAGERQRISPFIGCVSLCFVECAIPVFIDAKNAILCEKIVKFADEAKQVTAINLKASSSKHPEELAKVEGRDVTSDIADVLPSSADLFRFYRNCLKEASQLSGHFVTSFSKDTYMLFKKYLSEYAYKVLLNNFSKSNIPLLNMAAVVNIRETRNYIASFLKDTSDASTSKAFSREEVYLICSFLLTAEYCQETVLQLQAKMQEVAKSGKPENEAFQETYDFSNEVSLFKEIIASCIQLLAQNLETITEPILISMAKNSWASLEVVGDQSIYITQLISLLNTAIPYIRESLSRCRKYFTQFCIKFALNFITKFISYLFKCKPLGKIGAEQLLLDTHSLKIYLLKMPNAALLADVKPPISYTSVVSKEIAKAEMILKVVMSSQQSSLGKSFVENFISLLPNANSQEFQKVLEMKAVKRSEFNALMQTFNATHSSSPVSQFIFAEREPISPSETAPSQENVKVGSESHSESMDKLSEMIKNHNISYDR